MKAYTLLASISTLTSTATAVINPVDAGPNTLGFYNYNQRTASQNGTYIIVPLPVSAVQAAVPYPLIACYNDRSLFPTPLPANTHPVVLFSGRQEDIRMGGLEIDALTSAAISVPCVDRLRDGRTLFQYPTSQYIGGANGMDLMAYVPTLVGSLENVPIHTAKIYPDYASYRVIGPNMYASQVKELVAPNSVSGPGVVPAAFDLQFSTSTNNGYSPHTFHALVNQPSISTTLGGLLCFRNNQYFNETDTNGVLRTGQATIYNVTGAQPDSFAGRYPNVGGYSANAQVVGQNLQDCAGAAAQNDPSASQ